MTTTTSANGGGTAGVRTHTFVLVPGAGGRAWYWHLVVAELRRRGHEAIAVDLPAADDSAGLREYTTVVLDAVGDRTGLVVVGQSMGGLTATLVCAEVPVQLLVLLNAMVPRPGETPGEWWTVTGHEQARVDQARREGFEPDMVEAFLHDLPGGVRAEAEAGGDSAQSGTPFALPWPLAGWPDVPTRFLQARDDRFFPIEFQRRVVGERLGIPVDEMPGGHLVALSRPAELTDRLEAYCAGLDG